MGKVRALLILGLVVCVAGCRKELRLIPLNETEKELARQETDAFLLLIKDYRIDEMEKRLHPRMRPHLRPRLAVAIKEAKGYSQAELEDISSRREGTVSVRYKLTVDNQEKFLALYVTKDKDGSYLVTGADISEER